MDDGVVRGEYVAFISYSASDAEQAVALMAWLERYRVPPVIRGEFGGHLPRRLYPVFRDRDELSSGSSLSEQLKAALGSSHNLIVICSPRAATSR